MTVQVTVTDDRTLVRGAIAMMPDLEEGIKVVTQTGNEHEVIEAVACGDVDVTPAGVGMPVMDGIVATSRIRREHPDVEILMVVTFKRPGYLRRAVETGASDFTVKNAPSDSLMLVVHKVMAGQRVVGLDLAAESPAASSNPLTERERGVLRATSDGGITADISHSLLLSQGTVRNYFSPAIHRTEAHAHAEAVVIACDSGRLWPGTTKTSGPGRRSPA